MVNMLHDKSKQTIKVGTRGGCDKNENLLSTSNLNKYDIL